MLEQGKSYTVTDWFGNKVANELKRNITMCDVFAILKETEKAAYCMLTYDVDKRKCMWVPKSALVKRDVGTQENGSYAHLTLFTEDYEYAVEELKAHWSCYK